MNLRETADLQKKVKVPVASDKKDTHVTDFQEYLQPVSLREGCLVAVMKNSEAERPANVQRTPALSGQNMPNSFKEWVAYATMDHFTVMSLVP